MKRFHDELPLMRRRYKLHLRLAHFAANAAFTCECERSVGHFRKHRPFGCERTRCSVCVHKEDKRQGMPTTRDLPLRQGANAALREWRERLY